jgi:hypothetical protein
MVGFYTGARPIILTDHPPFMLPSLSELPLTLPPTHPLLWLDYSFCKVRQGEPQTNFMELSPSSSIVQLLKNFPPFYGTRRFITAFIRALHLSLS